MKVLGLVTEYNPFHNGHKYHLNIAKELISATHTVAVMSGHFLQRGEPAIFDKWSRAEMAVKEGIDLVIELPFYFSCNSAEFFARGSIKLLDNLNVVDYLCFGSESGDINKLEKVADILIREPSDYKYFLKKYLAMGLTFPSARERALGDYLNDNEVPSIVSHPNNILGIEYIKALKKISSNIHPITIKRIKSDYNSKVIESDICSATAIRELMKENNDFDKLSKVVPKNSFDIIKRLIEINMGPVFLEDFEDLLLFKLRTISKIDLNRIMDVKEGLENRIIEAALMSTSYKELIENIKTKRYTLTRLQRILFRVLLDAYEVKEINDFGPQYIRVLGISNKGRELLRLIKKRSQLPIVTNLKNYKPQNEYAKFMIDLDIRATNIYNLAMKERKYKIGGLDYLKEPFILDNPSM